MRRGSRIFVLGLGVVLLIGALIAVPWIRGRHLTGGDLGTEQARAVLDHLRLAGGIVGLSLLLVGILSDRVRGGRALVGAVANVALIVVAFFLALCAVEVVLQFRYRDISVGGFDTPSRFTFYPKYYGVNQHGFRDVDRPLRKPPGIFRILVLGDSFTSGMGVKAIEDVYTRRLEGLLNSSGSETTFDVINASDRGWNTEHELDFFRRAGTRYQPDLVILGYFLNDAETPEAVRLRGERTRQSHLLPAPWGTVLYNRSYTYFVLERRLMTVRPGLFPSLRDEDGDPRRQSFLPAYTGASLARHTELLGDLIDFSQIKMGIPLVILVFPSLPDAREDPYPYSTIHAYVADVARDHGAHLVDLLGPLRRSDLETLTISRYDAHPNEEVHAIAARALFALLVEEGLLPQR